MVPVAVPAVPVAVAGLMARLPRLPRDGVLRVLDPGAGSGVLPAAVVDRLRREAPGLGVAVTAVEIDERLRGVLSETLTDLEDVGVRTRLVEEDFVDWALRTDERFDLVIQNPPYRKIRSGSSLDRALRGAGIAVPNIYAGFMALGSLLLDEGGQQVSITPRSWMNGVYFSEFRRALLARLGIDSIHTFRSRSEVFGDLGVLQETIIVSVTRGGGADNGPIVLFGGSPGGPRDANGASWIAFTTSSIEGGPRDANGALLSGGHGRLHLRPRLR